MKKLIILFFVVSLVLTFLYVNNKKKLPDFTNKSLSLVEEYCKKNHIQLEIEKEYSDLLEETKVISKSI